MHIHFYKYQGTGNDFIIIDNRDGQHHLTHHQINKLCDRRFGVGADGLMLLNKHEKYHFEMQYYNADGREGSMCGNGGRCLVRFANDKKIIKDRYRFLATDGEHEAIIEPNGMVALKMKDVETIEEERNHFILNTGSPHYVIITDNVRHIDVHRKGSEIRYSAPFMEEGINVNFVEQGEENDRIFVRTYERGVEAETLSCGTGVTASALVCYHNDNG
ncbi:MAG: diaminopimelate epimerase, partial [Flavisolibacter sp.]|nr:diaminopimelate epimerase [Flavisolibacter sp.]